MKTSVNTLAALESMNEVFVNAAIFKRHEELFTIEAKPIFEKTKKGYEVYLFVHKAEKQRDGHYGELVLNVG